MVSRRWCISGWLLVVDDAVSAIFHKVLLISLLCGLAGCSVQPESGARVTADKYRRPPGVVPLDSLNRFGIPSDGRCAGLPRAAVATHDPSIECIGILDTDLSFPRGVAGWNGDILVVDKGSHLHEAELGRSAGKLYRYVATESGFQRRLLIGGLDNPSSISVGRHPADSHLVYVSTGNSIVRFAPDAEDVAASLESVVTDLPLSGWHYLSAAYATNSFIYVTVPSATDHCEAITSDQVGIGAQFPCPEVDTELGSDRSLEHVTASVRRYAIDDDGQVSKSFSVVARGLRDALALVQVPGSSKLLAADNGWDDIDLERSGLTAADVPHDEINLIEISDRSVSELDAHFGWPYCYDDGVVTPGYEEFSLDCQRYRKPQLLLPAHSAPLAMLVHNNQLLVNLHGFEVGGRRTLAFRLAEDGLPAGAGEVFIDWNFTNQFGYLWGRPFGIAQLGPSTLVVTDDWNHALLVVQKAQPKNDKLSR